MDLTATVYHLTKSFPPEEKYGLTDQIRRAAASVPANIAEGSGRKTRRDFAHFLYISNGSMRELETLLFLSVRLGYVRDIEAPLGMSERVGMMLTKLRHSLERSGPNEERSSTNDK